jgi:DNA modification methylase
MSITPYYDRAGITLWHGDCREILPTLPTFDLVLTDPPYGIADVWKGGASCGWGKAKEQTEARNEWDSSAPDAATLSLVLSHGKEQAVWGGNYFSLPPSRGWLVWTKPERNFTLSEAELAWTSRDTVMRVFDGVRSDQGREHPTQKPLSLMVWCLEKFSKSKTVLDPFSGSGTTLLAALKMQREATGIEREERWCELTAKRLDRELAQGDLFVKRSA